MNSLVPRFLNIRRSFLSKLFNDLQRRSNVFILATLVRLPGNICYSYLLSCPTTSAHLCATSSTGTKNHVISLHPCMQPRPRRVHYYGPLGRWENKKQIANMQTTLLRQNYLGKKHHQLIPFLLRTFFGAYMFAGEYTGHCSKKSTLMESNHPFSCRK